MTNTWCDNYTFSFTYWQSDYRLLLWTPCKYYVFYVENKIYNAFFIIHISSLIIITITSKFKTIRITIKQTKIYSTFDIPKNSFQCFEMCHGWCFYKSTHMSYLKKYIYSHVLLKKKIFGWVHVKYLKLSTKFLFRVWVKIT
jgi:hypothetical protein